MCIVKKIWVVALFSILLVILSAGCTSANISAKQASAEDAPPPELEHRRLEVITPFHPTATPLPSATPEISPTPQATSFLEPAGCLRPPDDYTRVQIGAATLNERTVWMLQRAEQLYGGTIPIASTGVTQGSYNPGGVDASFGTHDGGGAVDITVRNIPIDWSIKYGDIPEMIDALRLAGFAAWFRDEREGLVPHIHAIAIGDRDLSYAAQLQLTGRYGYFRGYDGYPRNNGSPLTARYGNMVMCQWMLDMGYADLRGQPLPAE